MEKVGSGRYRSADEVVRRGLILLDENEEREHTASPAGAGDLAAIFADIANDVPNADWQKIPV